MKYCVLYSIIASDNRAATRNTGLGIADYALQRNGGDRYVLARNNTAILDPNGEEIDFCAVIGFNQDVNQATLNDLAGLQISSIRQVAFNPPKTRDEIRAYIRTLSGQDGADKVWVLTPGDSTSTANEAALLAKFEAL